MKQYANSVNKEPTFVIVRLYDDGTTTGDLIENFDFDYPKAIWRREE